ncbi:hypothetical protein B0H19DRAFT_1260158 [Mycena capillaripes]|nr:hypothetical protein B0H19DRAFT_1260158 [Mycena capillaripes]
MPVSFSVADHPAVPVALTTAEIDGLTPELLLAQACRHQYQTTGEILRSSFTADEPPSDSKPSLKHRLSKLNPFSKSKPEAIAVSLPTSGLIPTANGFVQTVILAYNKHHNLIIRPDDVWIAILTQFNFYVKANTELLRASFVAHDGKQKLKVIRGSREEMDFASMAREMVGLLAQVIVDPTLRAWVTPDFSTTTLKEQTAGAIVMMSTLKGYFEFVFDSWDCGIPRVTLDGTKADWEGILGRLEKLKEYGLQTTAWYHLLVPIISRFVAAFDNADDLAHADFWQRVVNREQGGGSGPSYQYSGWISAFCVLNEEGRWIGLPLNENIPQSSVDHDSLSAKDFWSRYATVHDYNSKFALDDTPFHMADANNIPSSYVEVPVMLQDSAGGRSPEPCTMVAGVVGTLASVSQDGRSTETAAQHNERDTVQPVTGWWMYLNRTTPRPWQGP